MRPLMLFIILLQASFLIAETPGEVKVREYLSQQTEIRAWVSASLRFGHYSHTLSYHT